MQQAKPPFMMEPSALATRDHGIGLRRFLRFDCLPFKEAVKQGECSASDDRRP
jgi:hypothetical protein